MMNGKNSFFDMDVGKAFAGFNLPGLDAESVMATQRKNLEAFTQANQLAVEGVQAVTRRQVEIAREAFEGASAAMREFAQPSAPEDRIAKHAELAKQAFEKGLANAREIAELFTKANVEAFDVISKRVSESLNEICEQAKGRAHR
jgi:phasin family protein